MSNLPKFRLLALPGMASTFSFAVHALPAFCRSSWPSALPLVFVSPLAVFVVYNRGALLGTCLSTFLSCPRLDVIEALFLLNPEEIAL